MPTTAKPSAATAKAAIIAPRGRSNTTARANLSDIHSTRSTAAVGATLRTAALTIALDPCNSMHTSAAC